jgi:glycosyltransferase involved in cell wall biosynthesis
MKILYITKSVIPSRTANSIHVMKMSNALIELGHEVLVLTPDFQDGYESGVVDLENFYGVKNKINIKKCAWPFHKLKTFSYSLDCRRMVKEFQPDLIFSRYLRGAFFTCGFKIPVIFDVHGPIEQKLEIFFLRRLAKSKSLAKISAVSVSLIRHVNEKIKRVSENVVLLANGADEVTDHSLTDKIPVNETRVQVGYIGHLYKGRGIDLILATAALMPECDFHIIGGSETDISFWKSEAAAKNVFYHGFVAPSEIQQYRNALDVLLAPYQQQVGIDGGKGDTGKYLGPIKIYEYMASKKAVIVSDLPPLREILSEDICLFATCDDPNKWKEAIEKLKNDQFRKDISIKAHEVFVNNYTWKKRAQKLVGLIEHR